MLFHAVKLFFAALIATLLVACGGDSAPAPTGLSIKTGESSATLSWDPVDGVEYWLFYGPSSIAPSDTSSLHNWIGLPGGGTLINVKPPYLVSGLVNGVAYSFTVNGRTSGGPGGPGATPVSTTPRFAGSSWTAGAALGSNDLRSVALGSQTSSTGVVSTLYLAAGSNGAMYSSADATTWTAVNYSTTARLNGATYLGGYRVAGSGGVILTSPDTLTWTAQTSGTSQNLNAITSNGLTVMVAVGDAGTILSSVDGVTWTKSVSPTTQNLYGVNYNSYNGGTWMAVGAAGTILKSADGVSWTSVSSGNNADLRGVSYGINDTTTGSTLFVVVGSAGTVLTSSDAVTWNAQTLPGGGNLNAVLYGSQFVTAGSGGAIFTSTNGTTWTAATTGSSAEIFALGRITLGYLALGASGTNLISK